VTTPDRDERTEDLTGIVDAFAAEFRKAGSRARTAATDRAHDLRDRAVGAASNRVNDLKGRAHTVAAETAQDTRKHRPSVYTAAALLAAGLFVAHHAWYLALGTGLWLFLLGVPAAYVVTYRQLRKRAARAAQSCDPPEDMSDFAARRPGRRARRTARLIAHAAAVYAVWLITCALLKVHATTTIQTVVLALEIASGALGTWWVCNSHWAGLVADRRRLDDLNTHRSGRHAARTEPATAAAPAGAAQDAADEAGPTDDEPAEEDLEPDDDLELELPPVDELLDDNTSTVAGEGGLDRDTIQTVLTQFNAGGTVTGFVRGPMATRYQIEVGPGVKVEKILALEKTIQMRLGDNAVKVLVPIPGQPLVGVDVPNRVRDMVGFADVLAQIAADAHPLLVALGKDIDGKYVFGRLDKHPHILIAGATGGGKSVCLNCIIMSIILRTTPEQVRLMLIDPKRVELTAYENIPHLITDVITDGEQAIEGLAWLEREMDRRYDLFRAARVRNIDEYNKKMRREGGQTLPYLVCVVDELADLLMAAALQDDDDEDGGGSRNLDRLFLRLGQLARAAGIHKVIATQRPSVDVVKGTIKANLPSRIAFAVQSIADSRVITDRAGAEKLKGSGDGLYIPQEGKEAIRFQCALVSDEEVWRTTDWIRKHSGGPRYMFRCSTSPRRGRTGRANAAEAAQPATRTSTEAVADMIVAIIAAEPGCDTTRISAHEWWNHLGPRPPSQPTLSRVTAQLEEEGHITRRKDGVRWIDYQLTDKGRQRADAAGLTETV